MRPASAHALFRFLRVSALTVSVSTTVFAANPPGADHQSQWVSLSAEGHLVYQALPPGDRILDFSFAGYQGGGVALPTPPVQQTVHPSGGNDSGAIQQAIDAVAKLPAVGGFRGAVLLTPGTFICEQPLDIAASGVVLRGSGSGPDGTLLKMTGVPHACVTLSGAGAFKETGQPVALTDAYVPSGATSFKVSDASGFKVGDTLLLRRPVTPAWVKFMGMDALVRDGKKQTWLSGEIRTERTITGLAGNQLTVDLPLTDSYDAHYLSPPGTMVVKCTPPGRISQVGVEHLGILSPAQVVAIDEPQHSALRLKGVADAWINDLAIIDTVNSVQVGNDTRRITVENVRITHSVATKGAAKPADFTANGVQILFDRCTASGDNLFYFVTGGAAAGLNVVLNCTFHGNGHIQPHARWATGLLVDSCQVPESGIDFMNRGIMGSGHGWAVGWAVAWNCVAKTFLIQQPPGAANWAIGCVGEMETDVMPFKIGPVLPSGICDSVGRPVAPASLYLAQLRDRLGPGALKNIGY